MMMELLMNILLLLGIVWMLLGIAYLWRIFRHTAPQPAEKAKKRPAVTNEQIAQARHVLVGRSKPFVSPSVPEVPAVSPSENSADNPDTFAEKSSQVSKEKEVEDTEEDNEMQVDYTMDETDEDTIIREELQIADDSLPEVSPSAILTRDLYRVNGWHRNDDTLDEESETEVRDTLQSIRGTQLMDYIKEATLKQEKDHQKLLAAIRKAEELDLEESNINSSSDFETDSNVESSNSDASEGDERPLSYYL